jgi:hypothetical protein
MLEPVPDTVEPAEQSEPPAPAPVVSTWSSTPARPATATSRAHRVNFLVVSGAALVVTGLVVARRGGRR